MKTLLFLSPLLAFNIAHAQTVTCSAIALSLAENAYGNYFDGTRIKVIAENKQYNVTIGIGNQEDGPHTYRVTFRDSHCNPKNVQVCDLTQPGYGPSKDCK